MPDPDPIAPIITVAALRERPGTRVGDQNKFPNEILAGHVAAFERMLRRAFLCDFTPRPGVTKLRIRNHGARTVILDDPVIQEITACTLDGVAQEIVIDDDRFQAGILHVEAGLACGRWQFEYVHGFDPTPAEIVRACDLYIRHEAMSDVEARTSNAFARLNPDGGLIERLSTADFAAGRYTGWIDVDRILGAFEAPRVLP